MPSFSLFHIFIILVASVLPFPFCYLVMYVFLHIRIHNYLFFLFFAPFFPLVHIFVIIVTPGPPSFSYSSLIFILFSVPSSASPSSSIHRSKNIDVLLNVRRFVGAETHPIWKFLQSFYWLPFRVLYQFIFFFPSGRQSNIVRFILFLPSV